MTLTKKDKAYKLLRKTESRFEGYFAMALLIAYSAIIIYDVFTRMLFNRQTVWGLTVVLGLFTWVCWLSASLAIRTDSHFRFTLVRKRISNTANYIVSFIELVLWVVIIGAVFYYSIFQLDQRIASGATIAGLDLPRYLLYASIPVGTFLMILRSIQQFYMITIKYRSGESISPDAQI